MATRADSNVVPIAPAVTVAVPADLPAYVAFARAAQDFLRERGLAQWVPAAHAPHEERLREDLVRGAVHKVSLGDAPAAFFVLSRAPGPWWPVEGPPAAYLSGIVVDRDRRGAGLGTFVLGFAEAWAPRNGCDLLRLDCHAGNDWLCAYYRGHGFVEVGRVEQHPGYCGVLFEKRARTVIG